MATHSSVLAWRIPGMGEPGGLPSMGRTESDTTEVTWQQQQLIHNTVLVSGTQQSESVTHTQIHSFLDSFPYK